MAPSKLDGHASLILYILLQLYAQLIVLGHCYVTKISYEILQSDHKHKHYIEYLTFNIYVC